MVSSSIDRGYLVKSSRKTSSHISGEQAILSRSAQAREECELCGIGRCCLVERRELFDDDV